MECGWTRPSIAAISNIAAARVIFHTRTPSRTALDAIRRSLTIDSIEPRVFLIQNGAESDLRLCRLLTCYAYLE